MEKASELDNLVEHIVRNNGDGLRGIILKYASVNNRQDLRQEIFRSLWHRVGKRDHETQPASWRRRIAANATSTLRGRMDRRRYEAQMNERIQFYVEQKAHPASKEGSLNKNDLLFDFSASLNESDHLVCLIYLDGLSYKQISEITDISQMHIAVKIQWVESVLALILRP
jgi:RNA polymerase sigma-70 factor (ECF subfamily)